MRIYCPTHEKSFPAPRRNPIKCENKNHQMAELDFQGSSAEPAQALWSYCSDCEHFWPSDAESNSRCPVCERAITRRYLCHRCYTFTIESDTPADVKNFTMTQEGVPQPGCPACLKEFTENAPLYEHLCEESGESFKTQLGVCPVCEQLIGGAPGFPSSAVEYMEKVKAKKRVRFSYEDDLLVADEGGEFVLIPNGKEHSIVLPQIVRFNSRQEFYDLYENHFHCENPTPGELIILYPAVVNRVEGGWRLKEAGRLAVSTRRPEAIKAAAAEPAQTTPPPPPPRHEPPTLKSEESAKQEQEARGPHVECPACYTLVKAKDTFCWKCGRALSEKPNEAAQKSDESQMASTMLPATEQKAVAKPEAEQKREESEATWPGSLKSAPTHTSILGAGEPQPELSPKERKLASILFLTLVGLAAFGLTLWLVLMLTS